MKYPKVGDPFYWKDEEDGIIHECICKKIEDDPNGVFETMYFLSLTKNGGGAFICESDLLDPNSDEVKTFIKENNIKKCNEFFTPERKKKMIDFMWLKVAKITPFKSDIEKMFDELINSGEL